MGSRDLTQAFDECSPLASLVMRRQGVPRLIVNILGVLLVVCVLAGCNDIASFSLAPYSVASARKVSYHDFEMPGKTTFVHFRYVVTARSDTPLYFKVENISFSINAQKSIGAYYDSVASFVPQWRLLKKGETVIDAYAVFPGTIDVLSVPNIEFINLGFSRDTEKRAGQ